AKRKRIILDGDVPSPSSPPAGCNFHPRCPEATGICQEQIPSLRPLENDHRVSCHRV
ncbi:peptide ABC transporter substrate-binding protein, partial [Dehalococcoidia bacterium]|nr:peptide ABC transporter substrate-binding protein [Dehalococcoidia bacterium]